MHFKITLNLFYPKNILLTIGAITVVINPVIDIAKPLIAPWTSPNSNAVVVPEPCAAVPHANPCDTSSLIFSILNVN